VKIAETKLAHVWRAAKLQEETARAQRLSAEREILERLGKSDDFEGTETVDGLAVSFRLNQKVDRETLKDLINSGRITQNRAGQIFDWKPSLRASAWKSATDKERALLSRAITTTPAKPGFKEKKA